MRSWKRTLLFQVIFFALIFIPAATMRAIPFRMRPSFALRSFSARSNPIALLVKVEIKSERIPDFLSVMKEDALLSRKLENGGCLRFDVMQVPSKENQFYFYEVYRDEEAAAFHKTTAHYKKWVDFKATGAVINQEVHKLDQIITGN